MNSILDEILCKDFPNLYRDRHGNMMNTCMCWGFECGDGWFELLYNISYFLEKEIESTNYEKDYPICASQVKEKYGTLRFYMSTETDKMSEIIDMHEKMSEKVCERCGGLEAKTRTVNHWVSTICDECFDER